MAPLDRASFQLQNTISTIDYTVLPTMNDSLSDAILLDCCMATIYKTKKKVCFWHEGSTSTFIPPTSTSNVVE